VDEVQRFSENCVTFFTNLESYYVKGKKMLRQGDDAIDS